MRILHLIYDDIGNPWVGGGGATRTLEIYSRIAARDHAVLVACGHYPGASRRDVRQGVRYRRLGSARSHIWSRLTFMKGAARLIMRGGYDIVIEDVSPYSPLFSPVLSPHRPAVASVQNLSGRHATGKYGWLGVGPRMVERPLLRAFRNFVAVSPGVADELKVIVPDASIRVVPNSAGSIFSGAAERETRGNPYILSLGRVDVYQKGLDRLVRAFDTIAEKSHSIQLVLAGSGPREQEEILRNLVAGSKHIDRITLLSQVSQERAAELMKGALLLAMPSRYEAWPLTAVEAGAAGTPVVGSDIVGVRDAAPPYPIAHGYLVPDGDEEALVDAIIRMAGDSELRRSLGTRGREWARNFTWDALAEQQLQFYQELVSGRDAPQNSL